MSALPDTYIHPQPYGPRASGIYTMQSTNAHGITTNHAWVNSSS